MRVPKISPPTEMGPMTQADLAANRGSRGRNQPLRKEGLLEGPVRLSLIYLQEGPRCPAATSDRDPSRPGNARYSAGSWGRGHRGDTGALAGEAPEQHPQPQLLSYVVSSTS